MDLTIALMITGAALLVLLIILLIVWALKPQPRRTERSDSKEELKNIKEEIEHEAMEEVAPYKPARLDRPGKKRL